MAQKKAEYADKIQFPWISQIEYFEDLRGTLKRG